MAGLTCEDRATFLSGFAFLVSEISDVSRNQTDQLKGQGIQTGRVGAGTSASQNCPAHKKQGPIYYSLSVFAYVNIKAFQMPQEVITLMLKILIFNTPTYIFWSKPATL